MTIDAGFAEKLAAHYLLVVEGSGGDPGDDSTGGAAIPLFRDLLEMAKRAENGSELAFDVGVILGANAGIAATTMAPEAAITFIGEQVNDTREMFKSLIEDSLETANAST